MTFGLPEKVILDSNMLAGLTPKNEDAAKLVVGRLITFLLEMTPF